MISQEQTRLWIERLATLATTEYVGANGLVFNSFDSRTNEKDTTSLIRDLGDYAQYVAWAGKLLDRPEWVDWAVNQAALARELGGDWHGLLDSFVDTRSESPRRILPWSTRFPAWQDDLLLGLVALYRISAREELLETITKLVDELRTVALDGQGRIAAAVLPLGRLKANVADPRYCGLIAEEFVEISRFTGRGELLDDAERIVGYWLSLDFFKQYGLIPDNDHIEADGVRYPMETFCLLETAPLAAVPAALICRLPPPLRWLANKLLLLPVKYLRRERWRRFVAPTATIMKSNTLLMFGLLEVMRQRPSDALRGAFMKWFESVGEKLTCPQGGYFSRFHARNKTEGQTVELGQNFALIEAFIEGYLVLKEQRLLDAAIKASDFWLTQRLQGTGLIREFPFTGWDGAVLDPNTDMAVNYLKLAELTGQEKYREAALGIAEGINNHLWMGRGLHTQCQAATGGRTQSATDYTIKIKWNLLHLKLLLLIHETLLGRRLLGNPDLWKLARDR